MRPGPLAALLALGLAGWSPAAAQLRVEVSDDGLLTAVLPGIETETPRTVQRGANAIFGPGAIFNTTPDWENDLRLQVGGLQAADMNGDSRDDLVVGCYSSNSFPPYDDWRNFIYFNTGAALEASPSWVSDDERSTGDIRVGFIDADAFPDIFSASGAGVTSPSVIYFGSATGPSTAPGWLSVENSWATYARLFDLDHDGDTDVIVANQGSISNPTRPIDVYTNDAGTLETSPSWSSNNDSTQNWLDVADYDGDGWEDLAVSKWIGYESGIYKNNAGTLTSAPVWTTGDTGADRGVAFHDVDGNGWPDLALGNSPTQLFTNAMGTLTATWNATGAFFGHSDLLWEDVDLDGDQDLAEVHFGNGVANIYLNQNGTLDTTPAWSYDSSNVGNAIAFGDFNGDGAPDLAIGYSGTPSVVVFINQARTPLFADGFESGDTTAWSTAVTAP